MYIHGTNKLMLLQVEELIRALEGAKAVKMPKPVPVEANGKHYRTIVQATRRDGRVQDGDAYDHLLEVREYQPCKRTVSIDGENEFLQFPYMLFTWVGHKYVAHANNSGGKLFVVASKSPIISLNDKVYHPTLPNVFNSNCGVCMPSPREHTPDKWIETFWQSMFRDYYYSGPDPHCALDTNFNGSLDEWKRCSPEQVIERIKYGEQTFRDWMGRCWTYPYELKGANYA